MIWWIILFVSIILFILIAVVIIPKFLLKLSYVGLSPKDVGLKIINEKNGVSVLYDATDETGDYIDQYILSKRSGKKVLICRINDEIKTIDYDVVVYNKDNSINTVFNVYEKIKSKGYTRKIELPNFTSHVVILLNSVDDKKFYPGYKKGISGKRKAAYLIIESLLLFALLFVARYCVARIFGDVFYESYLNSTTSILIFAGVALVAEAINFLIIFLALSKKQKGR